MNDYHKGSPALGAIVRRYRQSCGLTQKMLAGRIGVDQSTVSSIEIGRRYPAFDTLMRISDHLGANLLREIGDEYYERNQ